MAFTGAGRGEKAGAGVSEHMKPARLEARLGESWLPVATDEVRVAQEASSGRRKQDGVGRVVHAALEVRGQVRPQERREHDSALLVGLRRSDEQLTAGFSDRAGDPQPTRLGIHRGAGESRDLAPAEAAVGQHVGSLGRRTARQDE